MFALSQGQEKAEEEQQTFVQSKPPAEKSVEELITELMPSSRENITVLTENDFDTLDALKIEDKESTTLMLSLAESSINEVSLMQESIKEDNILRKSLTQERKSVTQESITEDINLRKSLTQGNIL